MKKLMKNKPKHNHFIISDLKEKLLLDQDSHGRIIKNDCV